MLEIKICIYLPNEYLKTSKHCGKSLFVDYLAINENIDFEDVF